MLSTLIMMTLINFKIQNFMKKKYSLSLFHVNACSLSKKFYDIDHLLKCTNKVFDIVAASETRFARKKLMHFQYKFAKIFF